MSLSADVTAASRSDAALAVAGGGAGGPHGGGLSGHGPSSVASLSSAISSLASTLLNIRNKSPAAGEGRRSKSGEGVVAVAKICQQYCADCCASYYLRAHMQCRILHEPYDPG